VVCAELVVWDGYGILSYAKNILLFLGMISFFGLDRGEIYYLSNNKSNIIKAIGEINGFRFIVAAVTVFALSVLSIFKLLVLNFKPSAAPLSKSDKKSFR
jgi:O-antigen/teichoic acid export membrane protein